MVKEIKAHQGQATAIYRFHGKEIYLKTNSVAYSAQMVEQIRRKGGNVIMKRGWSKCDIFGNHKTAKLGDDYIDVENDSPEDIERILHSFFLNTLKSQGFICEVIDYGHK